MNHSSLIAVALSLCSVSFASAAQPAKTPTGVWQDHTGRGFVEITDCGGKLCGTVIGVAPQDREACGVQVIGAVAPVSAGRWDGGWIFDPEENAKYDVAISQLDADRLKVTGYQGSILFGESFVWHRATAAVTRCR